MVCRCCQFSYKRMHIHLHKFQWIMAAWVCNCISICVCYLGLPGSLQWRAVRRLGQETLQVHAWCAWFLAPFYFLFEVSNPFSVICNGLIRLKAPSNHCSMCFCSIKDLYESFMEHTFLEFRRILQVIIHNICHLLQRALKHPFNVYLMLLIQYNIKSDVLYYGGPVCVTALKIHHCCKPGVEGL